MADHTASGGRIRRNAQRLGAVATLCLALGSSPAMAACTDPPASGVEWRNCNFNGNTFDTPVLAEAVIRDSTFNRAVLDGAQMTGVDARRAKFVSASLKGADLAAASLRETDFTKADLTGANLAGADLTRARLFRAILREANMTGAQLSGSDLENADLTGAIWIDGASRCGEGSIGLCKPVPLTPQASDGLEPPPTDLPVAPTARPANS